MEPKGAKLGFYRKVKTGCLTCKARKVKCDEAKPHCQRCTKTGRKCDGYRSPTPDSRKRALTVLSSHPSGLFQSDAERRSFSYFQTHAGKAIGGHFNQAFWGRQVMQAAIHFPPIRHLVIALGSAYENFETGLNPRLSTEFAFEQCNASIKLLSASNNDADASSKPIAAKQNSPEAICSVLTASILFIYLASMQGYVAEAVQHVQSAIKLLRDHHHRSLSSSSSSSPASSPRNNAELSPARFPIPLSQLQALLLSIYAQLRIMIDSVDVHSSETDMLTVNPLKPATIFLSIEEAHGHVEQLLHNMHSFMQSTWHNPPSTPEQFESVVKRHKLLCEVLTSSRDALDEFESRCCSGGGSGVGSSDTQKGIITLKLYHLLISIRLRINVFAPRQRERAFDQDDLDKSLRKMLAYCEVLAAADNDDAGRKGAPPPRCVSGLGYIMPLHMIAARCRDPAVRKRALELLVKSKRIEGLWNGRLTGLVAEETVKIEERGVVDDERVREVKIEFRGDRGAVFKYVTVADWEEGSKGHQGERRLRESVIEW